MSLFLTILIVLAVIIMALEIRRRIRKASGRLRRASNLSAAYGSPGIRVNRKAEKNGGRKKPAIGSRMAGPVMLGLVIILMTAWLAFSFFMPDVETKAEKPAAINNTAQALQTKALGGRLFQETSSMAASAQKSANNSSGKATTQASAQPQKATFVANAAKSLAGTSSFTRLDQIGLLPAQTKPKRDNSKVQAQPTAKGKPTPPAASRPQQASAPETQVVPTAVAAGSSSAPSAVRAASSVPGENTKPAASAASRKELVLGDGRTFTVHLGSFVERDNAEQYRDKLAAAGERAVVTETTLNGQHWYRVMSGRFSARSDAENYGSDLKRRGLAASTGKFLVKSID